MVLQGPIELWQKTPTSPFGQPFVVVRKRIYWPSHHYAAAAGLASKLSQLSQLIEIRKSSTNSGDMVGV